MKLKFMYPNKILYRNYKGEVSWREVLPLRLEKRFSSWHSQCDEDEVWLMIAYDTAKQADREFLLDDILEVEEMPDA